MATNIKYIRIFRMLFSNKANELEGLDETIYKNSRECGNASGSTEKKLDITCEMPSEPKYSPTK